MVNNYLSKNKLLTKAIPYIFVGIALLFVYTAFVASTQSTQQNYDATLTSQTYIRATNCFVAVPASSRTEDYIRNCYNEAESATGKKVDRYGVGQ